MEGVTIGGSSCSSSIVYVETDLLSIEENYRITPVAVSWCHHVVGCNQISRGLGIQEGMTISAALDQCPSLNVLSVEQAVAVSSDAADKVLSILKAFSPVVERLSLDRTFVQSSSKVSAEQLASDVQQALAQEVPCAVRVAAGPSKASAMGEAPPPYADAPRLPRFMLHCDQVTPCDRWRCIAVESQVRERLRTLTVRLLALAEEDGRTPIAVKLCVRRVESARCGSWKDTKTGPVPAKARGPQAAASLLEVVMGLFHRMVDFHHPFQLALLGLAFVRFHDPRCRQSVASCILRKHELSVQMVVNIKHAGGGPSNLCSDATPLRREADDAGPCEKRAKLDIVIKKRKLRERDELSSPSKLRVAQLNLNCEESSMLTS